MTSFHSQKREEEHLSLPQLEELYRAGKISRRKFLRNAVVMGMSLGSASAFLVGCGDTAKQATATPVATQAPIATKVPEPTDVPIAAGGMLNFGAYAEPADLDPHTTGDVASWLVLYSNMESLTMLDEKESVQPMLAESWEVSDDNLTFTFHLRKGAKFHNGREVKAEDVKYSIERIMDPDVPARAKGYFAQLDKIEVVDDYTVKLVYKEVFAPLLIALARLETSIVPREEVEAQGGTFKNPVGSGPFKLVEHVPDVRVRLDKFEDHWRSVPSLDSVVYKPIVDNDVRVVNIKTGEMDVISQIAPKDVTDLQSTSGVVMDIVTGTNWPHVGMNCQREPFNNVLVRQAVHYGLNRPEFNELAYFGLNTLTDTPIPPSNPFHADIEAWPYDPEKAKELLAEAGYPDGFDTVMRVTKGTLGIEVVQAQLKQIGINIEVNEVEASEWFSEVFNKSDFWITMVAHASKIDPHLSLYDIQHSGEGGSKNYTQFWDEEMDEVLDSGAATTVFEERKKFYDRAQQILVERSGYIVLGIQRHLYAHRDYVEDFVLMGPGDLRWWDTRLNK
jgi:peptide/nickel transport system substrate-binding protein